MMEELLAYALLLCEEIETEESYKTRLNELFLEHPEDEMLLYLEWESDLKQAIIYIRTHFDDRSFNRERFGKILMNLLNDYYRKCPDIRAFAKRMYSLWENLPWPLQDVMPFHVLSYADDPLSYGDEAQSRELYEQMLNYEWI